MANAALTSEATTVSIGINALYALLRNLSTIMNLHEIKVVILIHRFFATGGGGGGCDALTSCIVGSLVHEVVVHALGARAPGLLREDEFFENVVHYVTVCYLQWW